MSFGDRFWLLIEGEWQEVSKQEYVQAERRAGFHNTLGRPDEPATAAFGGGGEQGTTLDPSQYQDPFTGPIDDEVETLSFVCESCKKQDHDNCSGGTWCDCLHR